jgi:hypothetical protein
MMKKYSKYATLLLLAIVPAMMSCSDDEAPKKPSREIVQVDLYKAEAETFQIEAQYKLTYDGKGRISGVRTEYNSQEISYTHGVNSITYRWEGNNPEKGVFVTRFEASLRDGRVQVGSVDCNVGTESKTYNYNYHYTNRGYVLDATFGGEQSFNYDWGKTELLIKGHPATYDAQYAYSDVANDYSFDLNVLPQLVDARADVQLAMNSYAQLAGVIGTRFPYFLEDVDYTYNYLFDANDRLVQIVQTPVSLKPEKQITYWFMLHYADLK